MKRITSAGLALVLALAPLRPAQAEPVTVVELFTSQGCAFCPPADNFMAGLAQRDDVLPLALHVDYWDYLGWKDSFADPRFTERQKAYARQNDKSSVYTPHFVLQGYEQLKGNRTHQVAEMLSRLDGMKSPVTLEATRAGDTVSVGLRADAALDRPVEVALVRYIPKAEVPISRGENAGRTIDYVNIVTEWRTRAEWDGAQPAEFSFDVTGDEALAVIVQQTGQGMILAAARVD